MQNLFQEQKNPWVPYNPYVSKFNENPTPTASTSTLSDADEGIVELDDEYVEEDEDTFRKRQDLVNPNSFGGRQTYSQSDMTRRNKNPYKVSMDRNPDSFRIPPTRNKLQLTPDTPSPSSDPDSYQMKPKMNKNKMKKTISMPKPGKNSGKMKNNNGENNNNDSNNESPSGRNEPDPYQTEPMRNKQCSLFDSPNRPYNNYNHNNYNNNNNYKNFDGPYKSSKLNFYNNYDGPSQSFSRQNGPKSPIQFPTGFLIDDDDNSNSNNYNSNSNPNDYKNSNRVLLPRRQQQLKQMQQQQQQQQQQQHNQQPHNLNAFPFKKPDGITTTLT